MVLILNMYIIRIRRRNDHKMEHCELFCHLNFMYVTICYSLIKLSSSLYIPICFLRRQQFGMMCLLQLYIIFAILTFGSSPEAGSVTYDNKKMTALEVIIPCIVILPKICWIKHRRIFHDVNTNTYFNSTNCNFSIKLRR